MKLSVIKSLSLLFLAGLLLSACGNRTKFETAKNWIPPLHRGEGRLFVYQPRDIFTTFSTFTFVLDGKEIADFNSGTGFYLDLKAGEYEVSYNRGKGKMKIAVPEGEELYLKYSIVVQSTDGRNFRVDQVSKKVGEEEMGHTFLIDPEVPYIRFPRIYL